MIITEVEIIYDGDNDDGSGDDCNDDNSDKD